MIILKKVLVFTWYYVSHIIPLRLLLSELCKENEVICFGYSHNRRLLEEYGCKFISYVEEDKSIGCDIKKDLEEQIAIEKNILKIHKLYTELGAYQLIYSSIQGYRAHIKIVKDINPDIILRDSCCFFSKYIGEDLNIKTIGFVTSNMYTPRFIREHFIRKFKNDNSINVNELINNTKKIYKKISCEFNWKEILPFHTVNPYEHDNIIFSTPILQPKIIDQHKFVLFPTYRDDDKKKYIIPKIKDYFKSSKKLIYLATGSFLVCSEDFYGEVIRFFNINKDLNIIISIKSSDDFINNLINKYNPNENIILIKEAPQKEILKNSDLFITSCGFNSILEAINCEVPMMMIPIANEQTFNAEVLFNLGVARYLTDKENMCIKTLRKNIDEMINNKTYKERLIELNNNNKDFSINTDINKIISNLLST